MKLLSMRVIFLVVATLCLGTVDVVAQTTWNPSDAAPGVVLSAGNLTATMLFTNVQKAVRATTAKYSGKYCYEFTANTVTSGFSIGFANSDYTLTYQADLGWTDFNNLSPALDAVGLSNNQFHPFVNWYAQSWTNVSDPSVTGKTGEACIDLTADPVLTWFTPDVTGTGGAGGGPKWNGSTTADPVGDVGGAATWLPSLEYFPTFSGFNNDAATGIFTGFTPPSGYNTWDSAGGTPSVPGPYSPLTINLANAPAYANNTALSAGIAPFTVTTSTPASSGGSVLTFASVPANVKVGDSLWDATSNNAIGQGATVTAVTSTTVGISPTLLANVGSSDVIYFWRPADRFVAGPAWDGSTYTDGSPLYLWQVTSSGTTSASGHAANMQSCGNPSSTGGIYSTSFPGATAATDGTVTAVCLSKVDYLTIGSVNADTALTWSANAPLNYDAYIKNGKNIYSLCTAISRCDGSNTNNPQCTTGTSGPPTGTVQNTPYTDGTCTWHFVATVPYSSGSTILPHIYGRAGYEWQLTNGQLMYAVHIVLWYGGFGQQLYYNAAANENPFMIFSDHTSALFDTGGPGGTGCLRSPWTSTQVIVTTCKTATTGFDLTATAAPGDSFHDNIDPTVGPLRYDPTRGVALYSDQAYAAVSGGYVLAGSAFQYPGDYFSAHSGLQLKSLHGPAAYEGVNGSGDSFNEILEGGDAAQTTIPMCCGSSIHDSVIIQHSTGAGCAAINVKYLVAAFNNTVIGPGDTNCTFYMNGQSAGISSWNSSKSIAIQNNVVVGFPNFYVWGDYGGNSYTGNVTNIKNNATSGTCCNAPFFKAIYNGAETYTPQDIGVGNNCGAGNSSTCYGLSASALLVNPTIGPTLDARIKSGAGIIGAGATFTSNYADEIAPQSTDILGAARPTTGRYDLGALQFQGTAPIPQRGPGRFMRGDNDNYLPFHEAAN